MCPWIHADSLAVSLSRMTCLVSVASACPTKAREKWATRPFSYPAAMGYEKLLFNFILDNPKPLFRAGCSLSLILNLCFHFVGSVFGRCDVVPFDALGSAHVRMALLAFEEVPQSFQRADPIRDNLYNSKHWHGQYRPRHAPHPEPEQQR